MFRLKAIAAAVLLAGSTMASAQLVVPTTGNGSLTFVAYDPVSLTTYSFNTGRFLEQFLPSAVTAPGTTFSFTLPSWTSFLATSGLQASNVLWTVFGGDALNPNRFITTGATAGTMQGASRVVNVLGAMGSFFNVHNLQGTHPTSPNGFAIYSSDAATVNNDFGYGGRIFGPGNNWNNNTGFSVLGNIGQSLGFYAFGGTNLGQNNCGTLSCTRYDYTNAFGSATWTLNQDGTLVYTAPVPEASTYAMMLAGLLTLGFVARRRLNGK
jgi:hypothetical protein